VATASARNVDEMPLSGLAAQALQPNSSLSLVSSGYGTYAGSEKSRWSHADVCYLARIGLLTYFISYLLRLLSFQLCRVFVSCYSGYRVAHKWLKTANILQVILNTWRL